MHRHKSTYGLDMEALRQLLRPLPAGQADFDAQVDRGIAQLLPVLAPVCGAFLILFAAWDAWLDPSRADITLPIRVAMALLGALAHSPSRRPRDASWRCAWLYATQTGAIVVCAALLPAGLVLALPAVTGAMFLLALIEPRPARFALIALPPSLLLALLAAIRLAPALFLNSLLLLGISWLLALSVALANLQLRRRLFIAEQAVLYAVRHDSLSGALSRGHVFELGAHDVALARRHGRPLAVAMLDIDHFKRVNDDYGHAAGDQALCALVAVCRERLRSSDYIGRIGGEEFVCVMPEAGAEDALACAERIRTGTAALRLQTNAGLLRFSVSLGVAVLGSEHAGWTELLQAADAALYEAKRDGRNRIVLARPMRTPPVGRT